MPSPKHEILSKKEFQDGRYTLSLDRITRLDEDNRIEYAFVWRGDRRGPDYIVQKPAYFNWAWIGELIRKAISDNNLAIGELEPLFKGFMGIAD